MNPHQSRYGWWLVAALSVTTTVGYGVLAYAFAVFLVPMQHALSASRTEITLAAALTLLASAAGAVPAGRWFDKHGGRALMVASSIAAVLGVLAWSRVQSLLELYLVSIWLGIAGVGVLYEAAFAVVVSWFRGQHRSNAMLAITIVGGFASTIFLPLTGFLVESYGWRQSLVVLAVIYGTTTIPLHLMVRRPADRSEHADESAADAGARRREVFRAALRDRTYWLIAASFVVQSVGVFVLSVHAVAYLVELGHVPTLAATIAGMFGVLSVTGRLVTTAAQRWVRLTTVVAVIFVIQALGMVALPFVGFSVAGAVACLAAVGVGFGVGSIARPALLADRYGVRAYATLAGLVAALLMVTKALAPLGAAELHRVAGGYTPVMFGCAVGAVLGAIGLLAVGRRTAHATPAADGEGHRGGAEAEQARSDEGQGVGTEAVPHRSGDRGGDRGTDLV